MRRVFAGGLVLLITGWLLLGGMTVVLAVVGPFHPGGTAFALQMQVEETGWQLFSSPEGRAGYAVRLLARRARDVEALNGTPREAMALPYLNYALDRALVALADVPATQGAALWAQMTQVTGQARRAVAGAHQARQMYPETVRALLGKLDTLTSVAEGRPDARALLRVVGIVVPFPPALAALVPKLALMGTQTPLSGGFSADKFHAMHAFFPLVGKHALLACEQCHRNGQYVGTPAACEACHTKDKPVPHFNAACDLCHTPTSWKDAHFDHPADVSADCASCHAQDKPANHFAGQCSLCHTTTAWRPAHFDHALAAAANCAGCHTKDAPLHHFVGQCSLCHTTAGWLPASFNHQAAGATNCAACHTKDRPANHFSGQCSLCHTTAGWLPASFNHQAAGATNCAACHTKDRPANHFSGQCSLCHNTRAWRPANFNHQAVGATNCVACHSSNKPSNHFSGQCSLCHNTRAWRPANFNHQAVGATNCVACHSGNKPANHFGGQCSLCHSTTAWRPAHFNHSFDINHGGANGQCSVCHPNGYTSYTCIACHDNPSGGGDGGGDD